MQWAYEKEWRVVSYARPGETGLFADYHFNAPELRRVIVGANCPVEDEAGLRKLLSIYGDIPLARARINQVSRTIDL